MNLFCKDTEKTIKLLKTYNIIIKNLINITKNKYFMKLYHDIKNNFKKIYPKNIKMTKIINKTPENYFEDNKFTSDNIKNKILNKLKYSYEFTYINNNIIYFCQKKINEKILIVY